MLKDQDTTDVQAEVMVLEKIEPSEPYRVCRRVNILRDYPDDKIKISP
ncbi:hypothetical protein J529_4779 [Acinetobacter baumannii 99063]|uniref:Uncharacterized protein n=1 Tax=Acinetobacter baumannii 99063 TaxID=1310630 RepID=A0A009R0T8_ACIBA|nr:hypothetical protein J529_4779 [Acinetobacter baumannii 99063]